MTAVRLSKLFTHKKADVAGFSVLELIIAIVFLLMIGGALAGLSRFISVALNQGEAKASVINTARNGLDICTHNSRNNLILFNTVPGTPLGVNFDLDDLSSGKPALRDGLLFYFDNNQSARLVDLNGDGAIDNLGLDDINLDGKPDLIGIGLVPQEVFGNGAQDFIDTNFDSKPDDLNRDGNIDDADRLWRLVLANFDNIDQINDITRWRNGRTIVNNIFLRKFVPNLPLVAANISSIQYSNSGEEFLPFDTDNNGTLSEVEIANSDSADLVINTAKEVKRIGAVNINLELAVDFDQRRKVSFTSFSSIIKPRAFAVLQSNDITYISDVIPPGHIN